MLNHILNQALEQYVFDRADNILSIAGVADAKYRKAEREVESVLSQLMEIARELEAQQPELLCLVMEYEAAANFKSGLAAEIVYREGIRDSCSVRQEFAAFMQPDGPVMF
ncbi:hypothetical protein [Sporomusa acidovorans]|uniref:Uncharacterized protein n=1 Tax=Sporomusa acidovorans (strain ATCC 49682 / DSM 3132 / Mol) TaxID=1123286 RepID=A0ABZ3JB75_SPOA4|nr:hypothetical protein [Sporomusa acidovorans]OZC21854.1 hypothetical protein SPACI_19290 [Sporomusa acidovorans DSM 3132]SDD54639.1 hypothetical protein SAMN04488499_10024 [Sporomusa acidovorans]